MHRWYIGSGYSGSAFDPQSSIELPEGLCETVEVLLAGRWAHVDVDCCVAGVVESGSYAADDDELNAVVEQHCADLSHVIVAQIK